MTSKELREKARAYLGAAQRLFDAADVLDELPIGEMTHDEIIGGSQYSELGTTGLIQDRMGNTYKKTS